MSRPFVALVSVACLIAGCGRLSFEKLDAGGPDAGRPDASDAGLDAATSDAGPTDAGVDDAAVEDAAVGDAGRPPPNPCTGGSLGCGDADFCTGFEMGAAAGWSYDCDGDDFQCGPPIPEASITQETMPACNGSGVYRASTEGGPGTRQNAYLGAYFPKRDGVFLRFIVRYPAATNVLGRGMVLVLGREDDPPDPPRFGFGRTAGELRVNVAGVPQYFAAEVPPDTWTCVELHMTTLSAEVWIDGRSVFTFAGETIPLGLQYDTATLGITGSSQDGPTELFFDDFALGPNRLGCP